MPSPKKLTEWQRRHKQLFEQAMLNPDVYLELGYLRRDTSSALKTSDSQESLELKLRHLMDKYKIQSVCLPMLKQFCSIGGDFDYSLVTSPRPLPKLATYTNRDRDAYSLWLNGKQVAEITETMRAEGYDVDLNYVAKIIKRMNAKDPNRDSSYGPPPGRKSSGH